MGHIISGQRAYAWANAWVQAHGPDPDDPARQIRPDESFWDSLPDETTTEAAGTIDDLLARLDAITDLSAERLAGIPDAKLAIPTRWAGFPVSLGFRFGRWSSHFREHGIQITKTLAMVGYVPDEPALLVRNLLSAYGRAESRGLRAGGGRRSRRSDRPGCRRGARSRPLGQGGVRIVTVAAAIVFAVVTIGVIGFQVALALGAPWGEYAMGGNRPGRFPPAMRMAAVVQAVVLGVLAVIVLSAAGLLAPTVAETYPWSIWLVVAFSAVSLVLNAISRSSSERRIWVPVTTVMLLSSLLVALTA